MKRFLQGGHSGQSTLLAESLDDYVADTNTLRRVERHVMLKRVVLLFTCLLGQYCCAQDVLKIVGQEGDERFFPLMRSVYEQIGFAVDFKLLPSERALSSVNSGIFDAEIGRTPDHSGKYPNLGYSSEPLLSVGLVVLAKKGSKITLTNPEDLGKYRVGSLIGMSIAESYIRQHKLKVLSVASHDQLAQMLDINRLDLVLMGSAFTSSPVFLTGAPLQQLSTANVHHIFSKKYIYLAPEFDKILRAMKSDGRYEQLLQN